jgi:hypothetical protein
VGSVMCLRDSSSRVATPSFERICETWYFAPASEISRREAISSFVRPRRIKWRTSRSRAVSWSGDRRFHIVALSCHARESDALVLSCANLGAAQFEGQGPSAFADDAGAVAGEDGDAVGHGWRVMGDG